MWVKKALDWKKKNLGFVMRTAMVSYLFGSRASYIHCYGIPEAPPHVVWKTMAKFPLFLEFPIPALDKHTRALEPMAWSRLKNPVVTPYAILLPCLILYALVLTLKKPLDPVKGLTLMCMLFTGWVWGTAMFSDGIELSRIRFPIAPTTWLFAGVVIKHWMDRKWLPLGTRKRRKR